jgi:hypothetical protein
VPQTGRGTDLDELAAVLRRLSSADRARLVAMLVVDNADSNDNS